VTQQTWTELHAVLLCVVSSGSNGFGIKTRWAL